MTRQVGWRAIARRIGALDPGPGAVRGRRPAPVSGRPFRVEVQSTPARPPAAASQTE